RGLPPMTIVPLPFAVVYAMLAGVLLALVVATVLNRWSPRVFFLLALRLAIGWHFLFEGLHKVHSHSVGPTDANPRTFSSEPYFRAAPGPVGAFMRRQFEDPAEVIVSKVRPKENVTPEAFAKLTGEQQAAACPDAVAKQLDEMEGKAEEAVKAEAEKELKDAGAEETKALAAVAAAEAKGLQEAKTDDEKAKVKARADADRAKVKADADKARQAARKKADSFKEGGHALVTAAKATYARWVYGVDGRPARVKFVSGDVLLTAPQRLEHIEWLRREVKAADDRRAAGLGNGTGTEQRRAAELRTDLVTAESDLARDANNFVAEVKKDLNGG